MSWLTAPVIGASTMEFAPTTAIAAVRRARGFEIM